MRLQVEKLRDGEIVLEVAEKAEDFPALGEMEKCGEGRFIAPVSGRVRGFWANGFVEVEGQIETRVEVPCSRCLASVEAPVKTEFFLTFSREAPVVEEDGEEVELSAEEMGVALYEGDEIDLRDALQEQVILAMPFRPLCANDCKGLCPYCGANLNEVACGCEAPAFNNRFSALKDFRPEKK